MPDEPALSQPIVESGKTSANMANQVDPMSISRFYANHAAINISLFEIRLIMGFVSGINAENGHLVALEQFLVSMSPELAKAVHSLLGKALENYTHDYGPIRGPIETKIKLTQQLDDPSRSALDMAGTVSPGPRPQSKG
jgi:hypothetical protein